MSEVRWNVDGSYVYLDHPYREARTVRVLNNLLVDVLPNGRVVGVEKVGGAITTEDLATVLFLLARMKPPTE